MTSRREGEDAGPEDSPSPEEIRGYYRTVGRFIEQELSARGDAEYWRSTVNRLGHPRVLELGAGTGRVTRLFAEAARGVVGVDLSRDMLTRSRASLGGIQGVHLVLADIRRLAFSVTFGLVAAPNDPFVHLPSDRDRDRTLEGVRRHLEPGGRFVLDAHWLPAKRRAAAQEPEGWRRERTLRGTGSSSKEALRVVETWRLDVTGYRGRVEFEYRYGADVVGRARFEPRLWSSDEVERRLPAAGLRILRKLGSYDGTAWDPDRSYRLIVEAQAA